MALGEKQYETRHWEAKYRGLLAIHVAKRWQADQAVYLRDTVFQDALRRGGITRAAELPLGCVVAIGWLTTIHRTEAIRDALSLKEKAFGDYGDGRFAWRIECMHRLPTPIPARGGRQLWNFVVPAELMPVIEEIRDAIRQVPRLQPELPLSR